MVGDNATSIQDIVARARALMQQGQWRNAEALLVKALESDEGAFAPRRLLGTLYHLTGRSDEAVTHLRYALRLAPEDSRTHLNLGAALFAGGHLEDAERAFRAVLAAQPDMEDAHLNLGLVLQRAGRMSEAAGQFETVLASNERAVDARLSLALCHLYAGAFDQALAGAEWLLAAEALVPDALTVKVRALLGARQTEAASATARAAIEAHGQHAALHAALGDTLVATGQLPQAIDAYTRALSEGDTRLDTLLALAQSQMESGLYAEAVAALDLEDGQRAALASGDDVGRVQHLQLLGEALSALGLYSKALRTYENALGIQPESVDLHTQLAKCLFALGRDEEARVRLARAIEQNPKASAACQLLVEHDIAAGRLDEALGHCERYTDGGHFAHDVLAAQAYVQNALGQPAKARTLMGIDTLVATFDVTPPAGYGSLQAFNQALAQALRAHPSLTAAGAVSKATQNGQQSGNLLGANTGVFADFEQILWTVVRTYLAGLTPDSTHPYLRQQPELSGVHCWGVVLKRAGYQAPHIHPTGWVSGVYYPELPSWLGDAKTHEGWLEFGAPPEVLDTGAAFQTRRIQPREGLLVLFPSYLYHSTVPFEADDERVSLAFDFTYAPWS